MAVVYTGGTFDLLHKGHIELLEACSRMAGADGKVIVGLNSDGFVKRFKGKKPFMSYADRKLMLETCKYVDHVVENLYGQRSWMTIQDLALKPVTTKDVVETEGYYGLRLGLKVDIVAIGTDWAPPKDYYAQMGFTKEWLDEKRIVLVYVDRRTGESTTDIKRRLRETEE